MPWQDSGNSSYINQAVNENIQTIYLHILDDKAVFRYQNVNKEKTGLYFNQSSVQRKICCHNSNESSASTYVCIPPSRYSKSIGVPMDCIYQGDCLLPKHLRHIRNMALYINLFPFFRSLSVKHIRQKWLRQYSYGAHYTLHK